MLTRDELSKKFERLAKGVTAPVNLQEVKNKYSNIIKDELIWELEERKISHLPKWSKKQMVNRLEEDDKVKIELSKTKDESIQMKYKLVQEYLDCEVVYKQCIDGIVESERSVNELAGRRDVMREKMEKVTNALEYLK